MVLLLLIGCSKSITPDMSGHWTFTTDGLSADFTIVHGNPYQVAKTGSFTIAGVKYPIDVVTPITSAEGSIQLASNALNTSYLQFYVTPAADFSHLTGGNPCLSYQVRPGKSDTTIYHTVSAFAITRK